MDFRYMTLKNCGFALLVMGLLSACDTAVPEAKPTLSSQTDRASCSLYFGGDIITMANDSPGYVDAVLVNNATITFAGSKQEARFY